MKVLITGATGTIGGAIFRHCNQNSAVTAIVTLTRRPFSSENPKCSNIVISDWKQWDKGVLAQIADADAMVWALGTSDTNKDTNYNYIVAFQKAFYESMSPVRQNHFRFILTSGALVESDQNKTLYFMSAARKLKGEAENWSLGFAQEHRNDWKTWIIRPGGVSTASTASIAIKAAGMFMPIISDEQVGAFVADLVVNGKEAEGLVLNQRMAVKGTELLKV